MEPNCRMVEQAYDNSDPREVHGHSGTHLHFFAAGFQAGWLEGPRAEEVQVMSLYDQKFWAAYATLEQGSDEAPDLRVFRAGFRAGHTTKEQMDEQV